MYIDICSYLSIYILYIYACHARGRSVQADCWSSLLHVVVEGGVGAMSCLATGGYLLEDKSGYRESLWITMDHYG